MTEAHSVRTTTPATKTGPQRSTRDSHSAERGPVDQAGSIVSPRQFLCAVRKNRIG
jgi:hypothetical protein